MGNHRITDTADPVALQDVATKKYVDDNSGGNDSDDSSFSTSNDLSDIDIYTDYSTHAANSVTLVNVTGSGKLLGGTIRGYYIGVLIGMQN